MNISDFSDKPRTSVSFFITGDELLPDKVSQSLGLIPDRSHKKGEIPSNPNQPPPRTGTWTLKSQLADEERLSNHLENLLSILESKQKQIIEIGKYHNVIFRCVLYSQNGFGLSSELLRQISEMGIGLSVTIYP